jgi:Icc-related predicted phosphoesterase
MIIVIGDLHNAFGRLNDLINKKKVSGLEMVICCGDFGYWPNKPWAEPLTNIKPQGIPILWCDGNHEDHWAIKDRETDELVPLVFYKPRGSTHVLPDGRRILFMGGADSIDKHRRTEGDTWFREEVITQSDFKNLPDEKIDIFITHTCPAELHKTMVMRYPEKYMEPSNHALSKLWEMYKPKLWYFGHWHQYKFGELDGTQWFALGAPQFRDRWWLPLQHK